MKKISILIWACTAWVITTAQDLSFSQFYEKPLLRNPALAGVFDGDVRVTGAFRNQWQSISVPFQTSAASIEYKIPFNQHGDWLTLGLQSTLDVAGDIKLKRTQVLPVLNFHKSLSADESKYLSIAFSAGPVNSQFDPTKLKLNDQFMGGAYNPNAPTQVFERTGFNYWTASTGISYSSSYGEDIKYYVGVGLFHFNKPKVAFYTSNSDVYLQPKLALNGGITIQTTEVNRIIGYADYFSQGGNKQFMMGMLYGTDITERLEDDRRVSFYVGAAYRWNDALVPVAKIDVYRLGIGLSYDVTVNKLSTATQMRGGFELTLSYKANLTRRNSYTDAVQCVGGF
ncbi:MAG: type IX secretion system membrane protein PorP/SprF [Bacteroidetes bacterium]|nr:MAG: type IX secretion system membrane protein PorP/SprF [Bacteroidota bacterium]TAF92033.1 MAG: type IX secretion system membrane protein PorP/SprF [Bacteroidota bacterium]